MNQKLLCKMLLLMAVLLGFGFNAKAQVTFDYMPVSVTPANNSTLASLKQIEIATDVFYANLNTSNNSVVKVYDQNGNDVTSGKLANSQAVWSNLVCFFEEAITATGVYTVVVPQNLFGDDDYFWGGFNAGRANPELTYTYIVTSEEHPETLEYENLKYEVTVKGKEVAVTRLINSNYSGEIVIPESITYEGVEYSVTSIGDSAFNGCSGLTSIEIPNSVTSIGNGAFKDCSKLTIITLGNSLLSIGKNTFKACNNIKKVESKATKAPIIENEDQFSSEVYQKADLFVPLGYEDNYKYAYAWSEFNNIVGKDFTIRATSIALDKTEVTLKQSESVALTETILPYETSNKTVVWSTSDESVATVDANGLVTAISVGEATITATTTDDSNLSATCKVIVVPTLAISIEVTPREVEAEEGSEVQLSVVVLPEEATNKEVAWSSSNESVATVDNNGLVSIHKEGEATITATTTDGSNLSATCVIKAFSGIVEVESLNFYVKVVGDDIVVCDAELGSQVAVYGIDGLLVGAKEVVDMQTSIAAPIKGIYLVRVGETMVKVLVK